MSRTLLGRFHRTSWFIPGSYEERYARTTPTELGGWLSRVITLPYSTLLPRLLQDISTSGMLAGAEGD